MYRNILLNIVFCTHFSTKLPNHLRYMKYFRKEEIIKFSCNFTSGGYSAPWFI